jgi:hypothetical protein
MSGYFRDHRWHFDVDPNEVGAAAPPIWARVQV